MSGVWRMRLWLRTRRQNSMPSTPGMLHVGEDEPGPAREGDAQRLLAVSRLVHREVPAAEHVAQEGAEDRVVVDHQHRAQGVGKGLQLLEGRRAAGQPRRVVGHDRLAVVVELLEAHLRSLRHGREGALDHLAGLEDRASLSLGPLHGEHAAAAFAAAPRP